MSSTAPASTGTSAPVRLSELTTLQLGGPAPSLHVGTTPQDVVDLVAAADRAGRRVLVLGGGSNLVVADTGVTGPVVRVAVPGLFVDPRPGAPDHATVTVGAGEDWDEVVAELVADGWSEVAPLSGIPGSAGATPVQNVGAYGTELAEFLTAVTVYDRRQRSIRSIPVGELALGYRTSMLRGTERAVVLDVTLELTRGPVPVRYSELAAALGVAVGDTAPPDAVREAVLRLRRAKGMVLDAADPDTRSVGSFFTNPILDRARFLAFAARVSDRLGPDAGYPRYPAPGSGEGAVKLSAAWLIERSGFTKGYPGPGGRVAVSSKHTLALTNRGNASTADLVALAREIRDGVRAAFGVTLHLEPVLVGVSLD